MLGLPCRRGGEAAWELLACLCPHNRSCILATCHLELPIFMIVRSSSFLSNLLTLPSLQEMVSHWKYLCFSDNLFHKRAFWAVLSDWGRLVPR